VGSGDDGCALRDGSGEADAPADAPEAEIDANGAPEKSPRGRAASPPTATASGAPGPADSPRAPPTAGQSDSVTPEDVPGRRLETGSQRADICPSLWKVLKPHQVEGVGWLFKAVHRGGGLLADDPGLGKTLQVITVLEALVRAEHFRRVLIVTPANLLANWDAEFRHWLGGTPHELNVVHLKQQTANVAVTVQLQLLSQTRAPNHSIVPPHVTRDEPMSDVGPSGATAPGASRKRARSDDALTGERAVTAQPSALHLVSFVSRSLEKAEPASVAPASSVVGRSLPSASSVPPPPVQPPPVQPLGRNGT